MPVAILRRGSVIFRLQAVQIILQDGNRGFLVAPVQQYLDKLAHVARRHAGRFMRQQYALLARFRHFRPEHPVQDVGMRLHQDAGLAHLVFLQLQDLAQGVHLPAHVLHHLVHRVDLHFALLEAFQGETNGHVLGRFHQQRSVVRLLRVDIDLGSQAAQQLLQVDFGVGVNRGQFFLQCRGIGVGVAAYFSKSSQQPDGLDDFFFLQGHDAARPGSATRDRDSTLHRRAGIRNAAYRSAAGNPPPLFAPSAAAINCKSFCGSLSHCLNSGPSVWAAIWAAMLISPVDGSAATNLTSLIRIEAVLLSPKVLLISLTTSWALRSAHGESPHQLDKFVLGDLVRKMDAGQTRRGQQLRKAAFRLPRLQGNSVQQQLVFRDAQQERPVRSLGQAVLQFFPRGCELAFGAFVIEPIEADVLHQYVQTVDKRPGGRDPAVFACVCR